LRPVKGVETLSRVDENSEAVAIFVKFAVCTSAVEMTISREEHLSSSLSAVAALL
jgi:hypothetical protein